MENEISTKVANLIFANKKIAAVAELRKELGVSLKEAKGIADQLEADRGAIASSTSYVKSKPSELTPCYRVPNWLQHFWNSITVGKMWSIPKALRLAKKTSMPVNYDYLHFVAFAGRCPFRFVRAHERATKKGSVPDIQIFGAAYIILKDEEKFQGWVEKGMPDLNEYVDKLSQSGSRGHH